MSTSAPSTPIDPVSLPGPSGYPLVGIAPKLDREGFHLQLENWYREYGGRYTFKIGPKRFVVFADADTCKDVLRRRPGEFIRGRHLVEVIEELGATGLFTAEGDRWKKQRKLIMPGFTPTQLRNFFPQIQTITKRLHGVWSQHASDPQRSHWDFKGDFERFTTDVTTSIAFGHDTNSVEGGRDLLQAEIEQIFPAVHRRMQAAFPLWRYFKNAREREVEAAIERLRGKLEPIVAAARKRVESDPEGPDPERAETLLEAMIAAEMLDEGDSFTDTEIFGNVITLLLAGEDTTAHTLSWIAHALVAVDGVQEKMQAELDEVLGDAPGIVDFEDTKRLPYLNGVIHEALRLRSVAPLMFYESDETAEIDGITLAPGQIAILLTRHATVQEEHFTDAERFLPERWMRKDKDAAARCPVHNARAMLPFGNGPRICPGRGLSLLEMHVALAQLGRNFTIRAASDPTRAREVFAFTMHPTGFDLRLEKR